MARDIMRDNPAKYFGPAAATAPNASTADVMLANPAKYFGSPSGVGDAAAAIPTRLTATGPLADAGRVLGQIPGGIVDTIASVPATIGRMVARGTESAPRDDGAMGNFTPRFRPAAPEAIQQAAARFTPQDVEAFRERIGTPEARALPDERIREVMALDLAGQGTITPGAGEPADPRGTVRRNAQDFGQGVVSGAIRQPAAGISAGIGGLLELAGSPETARGFFDNAAEVADRNRPGNTVGGFLGQTVGSVAPSAVALTLGPAGPALVASYYGVQGFGSGVETARNAAIAQGRPFDPVEGAIVGMGFAAVESITEKLGFERITKGMPDLAFGIRAFKSNPTAAGAKGILDEVARLGLAGGAEEGASQFGQNVFERGVDPQRGLLDGVPLAAAGGAVGNLLLGGGQIARSGLTAAAAADAQRVRETAPPQGTPPPTQAPQAPQSDRAPADAQGRAQAPRVDPAQATAANDGADAAMPADEVLPEWARNAIGRMRARKSNPETPAIAEVPELAAQARPTIDDVATLADEPKVSPITDAFREREMERAARTEAMIEEAKQRLNVAPAATSAIDEIAPVVEQAPAQVADVPATQSAAETPKGLKRRLAPDVQTSLEKAATDAVERVADLGGLTKPERARARAEAIKAAGLDANDQLAINTFSEAMNKAVEARKARETAAKATAEQERLRPFMEQAREIEGDDATDAAVMERAKRLADEAEQDAETDGREEARLRTRDPIERMRSNIDDAYDRTEAFGKMLEARGVPLVDTSGASEARYYGGDGFKIRIAEHDPRPTHERMHGAAAIDVNTGPTKRGRQTTHAPTLEVMERMADEVAERYRRASPDEVAEAPPTPTPTPTPTPASEPAQAPAASSAPRETGAADYAAMKRPALAKLARERGIDPKLPKAQLVERLKASEARGGVVDRVEAQTDVPPSDTAPVGSERKGILETIRDGAQKIAEDAEARQVARQKKRGTTLFSNPIHILDPRETIDMVLSVSGRAIAMGIDGTKASTKALARLVEMSIREIAPEMAPYAKDIRNQVARILRHKDATPENFERLIAEIQEPMRAGKPAKKVAKEKAAAAAKAAKGLSAKPRETPTITESEALRTRLKAEERAAGRMGKIADSIEAKAAREIRKALQTAYKRGGADYARAAEPVMEGLRQQIRGMAKKMEAAMAFARRGGQDEAKAAQAVKDGIRDQMIELAKPYPAKVRGALTAAMAKADTPMKMMRVLNQLDRRMYRARVADAAKKIVTRTGEKKIAGIKGVTEDLRTKAKAARDLARAYHAESRLKDVRTGRLKVLAEELDAKLEELSLEVTIARNEYADIKGLRGMNAAAVAHTTVRTLEAQKKEIPTEPGTDPERSKFVRARQNLWNIPRMLAAIEGEKGVLHDLIYKRGADAERETNGIRMAMYQEADQIAKAAGFKDLDDAETAFDRASGKGVTRMISVQIDGKMVPMTLGEALHLYGHATDPDAAVGFVDQSQEVAHVEGTTTGFVRPSMNDALALRLALEAEQPGITKWIDGVRALNAKYWPQVSRIVYRLTGTMPVTPRNRYSKIDRIIKPNPEGSKAQSAAAIMPNGGQPSVFAGGVLQAAKTYITRVPNRNPILLRNPATALREEMEQSAKMIGMAEWARDVENVLTDKTLTETAGKRVRPGMIELLREQVKSTYVDPPMAMGTARMGARVRSNLTTTFLGLNPKSYIVNALGFTRMLPDVRAQDLAGSAAMTAVQMRSLFKDIQRRNPFFWDRYSRPAAERIGGANTSSPDRPPMGLVRMLQRAAKNSGKADFAAAFGNTRDAIHTVMRAYNAAEAPAVVQGYAAKILESKGMDAHTGWTEDQHRDWAAVEAEMMVRATMPSNSNLDTTIVSTSVRNTGDAAWFTFTSDFLRARNRISQALRQDKKYAAKVIAAEAVQIVFGRIARRVIWYPIALGIAAAYGLDDEDVERLNRETWDWTAIGRESLSEALDLIMPGAGRLVEAGVGLSRGFGVTGAVVTPTTGELLRLAEGFGRVTTEIVNTIQGDEAATTKLLDQLWDFSLTASGVVVGNPLMPYIRAVNREAKRQGQPEAVNLLDEEAKELRARAKKLNARLDQLNAEARASNNYVERDAFLARNRTTLVIATEIDDARREIRKALKAYEASDNTADRDRLWKQATEIARVKRTRLREMQGTK